MTVMKALLYADIAKEVDDNRRRTQVDGYLRWSTELRIIIFSYLSHFVRFYILILMDI